MSDLIAVRLSPGDRELVEKVCIARGEDLSSFVRRAIRIQLAELSFYPEEVKKALGVALKEEA